MHADGKTIFVSNVAPREKITARIYKKAKGVRYAECESIIEQNTTDRTDKKCQHAGTCGGCSYQHLHHQSQIQIKEAILRETFQNAVDLGPTIHSPTAFEYRNKMEFGFTRPPGGAATFGLHPRGRFRHILDLQECHLIAPDLWAAGQTIKSILRADFPEDSMGEKGFWQHLILRQSRHTRKCLITIEAEDPTSDKLRQLGEKAMAQIPIIAGFCVKKRHGAPMPLLGDNFLDEHVDGVDLRYYAENFFQVNVAILPELIAEVSQLAAGVNAKTLYDLFSGVGLFGIALGKKLGSGLTVIAAEADASAAQIANDNAKRNGLTHYHSHAMDLYGRGWGANLAKLSPGGASIAVIDPPRAGLTDKTIAEIVQLSPKRLIYISCNPTTQKRDIDILKSHGYTLGGLRLIDMFPQTYHLESLAWLDRA